MKTISLEICLGCLCVFSDALIFGPIHYYHEFFNPNLYVSSNSAISIIVLEALLFFLFVETANYFWHFATHHVDYLIPLHSVHHRFQTAYSPFSGLCFHPLDYMMLSGAILLYPLFFPLHRHVYYGFGVFQLIWTVFSHDKISPDSRFLQRWVNLSQLHELHHVPKYSRTNLGNITSIWDQIMGTYTPVQVWKELQLKQR